MIFTQKQIQDILFILKKYELIFIGNQVGIEYLSKSDKEILKKSGIDISLFQKQGIIEHAFLFGILSDILGDKRIKNMSYVQFQKFLKTGQFIPLTENENFALLQIKNRAYTDISNLGNRMKNNVSNILISSNQKHKFEVIKTIKEKVSQAIELRKTARQLAFDLSESTKDWEVDWLRIAYYLMHEAYNTGREQNILKNYGEDAEVYFDVYEGACKECKKLYLVDPDDSNSMPIVFKLKEIIANGNNIGRKVKEWKATIAPIHPYCRCTMNYKRPNFKWSPKTRAFTIPIKMRHPKYNIKITK